ncbi:hypothetical protein, partial [Solidesulfovibrio alcoholivorans]|uniref:hypothetical protein n=1 Tax=Solidesulfovibrio alcoholivorans TaxID=81406 RepID=UPI001FE1AB45
MATIATVSSANARQPGQPPAATNKPIYANGNANTECSIFTNRAIAAIMINTPPAAGGRGNPFSQKGFPLPP